MNTESTDIASLCARIINQTYKNVFLTGKAGTGKTTFLKNIIENTHKKAAIVAPTGIAAMNAGGVTIHSLFQLPFGTFIPTNHYTQTQYNLKITDQSSLFKNMQMSENKRKLLRELELLIMDEVSMLRADILDAIDKVLRVIRKKHHLPFGGIQVLFIGDLLQLPPVVKDEEWSVLKEFYPSIFFFEAHVLQAHKPLYIELEKIYRQSDETFINLLNNLRNNTITIEDVTLLNQYYKPTFKPKKEDQYITLTTHNYKAEKINKDYLNELSDKSFYFEAGLDGEFSEYNYPVEKTLELKLGAQVMFVKNDPSGAGRFFNGKIGVIQSLTEQEIQVGFSDSTKTVTLERFPWKNVKYVLNETSGEIEEQTLGTFSQFPVKLAWAITIHKSQGLTFDKAIIDIGGVFAPGQVYVALSRLRTLQGLVLSSPLGEKSFFQDASIHQFSKSKTDAAQLENIVLEEQAPFIENYLLPCYDFAPLRLELSQHIETYTKDAKKSIKQQHKGWAIELKSRLENIKPAADKFRSQIQGIVSQKQDDYISVLNTRVNAAHNYFLPLFKEVSSFVLEHIEALKKEKKIKVYLQELLVLEALFHEQFKKIKKSVVFMDAMLNKKEFTKQLVDPIIKDSVHAEKINQLLHVATKKEKKAVKGETQEVSYAFYKEGKSLSEIASERNLAISTIESHLATFVAKGLLNASEFVSEDKINIIIAKAKELDTFNSAPIKNELGAAYSYSEIRFALAGYLSEG